MLHGPHATLLVSLCRGSYNCLIKSMFLSYVEKMISYSENTADKRFVPLHNMVNGKKYILVKENQET